MSSSLARLLALLQRLYLSPSGYPGDPEGWLGNQAAHALYIGGAIVALTGSLVLLGALYAAWELGQWWRGGGALDGLTDWLFVLSGGVLIRAGLAGDPHTFVMALLALLSAGAAGVWRRA